MLTLMCLLVIAPLIFYAFYQLYRHFNPTPDINPRGKYVLITGCDSGFGNGLALALDKQGFNVLATVYNKGSQTELESKLSSNATVFPLDLTKPEQIEAAFQLVSKKTDILHALVNNAGIDQETLIDWMTMDFMRNMMEVNFFGHVAMTKTFLPLLIRARGSRIVNLCSVAGFITGAYTCSYSASKYALESFSDCLRREMAPWGLHVSIIEPGYMRTPLIGGQANVLQTIWDKLPSDTKSRWGEAYLKNIQNKRINNILLRFAEDPIKVVHAMQHAVANSAPCIRYRPGFQSKFVFFPLWMIPAWLADIILDKGRGPNVVPVGVSEQLKN